MWVARHFAGKKESRNLYLPVQQFLSAALTAAREELPNAVLPVSSQEWTELNQKKEKRYHCVNRLSVLMRKMEADKSLLFSNTIFTLQSASGTCLDINK